VRRDAGRGEIVRAYRLCAKRLHPDVSPDPGALEQFKRAKAAYEALRDPVRRIRYDAMLAALDAPGPGVPAVVRPALFTQRVEDGLIGGFVSLAGIGMLYVLALLVAH
jgi:curved DNA-binding protein CbpA